MKGKGFDLLANESLRYPFFDREWFLRGQFEKGETMRRSIALLTLFAVLGGLLIGDGLVAPMAAQDKPQAVIPKKPLVKLLDEVIDMKDFHQPGGISLKDTLASFYEMLAFKGQELPILVDSDAFKGDAEAPDVYDTIVRFPPFPRKMTVAEALSLAIAKIPPGPGGKATFLIRSEHIRITTAGEAAPGLQTVSARFVTTSLPEALEELSRQTGIGIVLDPRCVNESRAPVTATFPPETSLVTAAGLLADMVSLQVRVVDRMLYVTSPTNNAPLPAGSLPKKIDPGM